MLYKNYRSQMANPGNRIASKPRKQMQIKAIQHIRMAWHLDCPMMVELVRRGTFRRVIPKRKNPLG